MDCRSYLNRMIENNERAQKIHEEALQREVRELWELKDEHTILCSLLDDANTACEVTDGKLKEKIVYNTGILMEQRFYSDEKLKDYIGSKVLVTSPQDGKIQVYSLEGVFLADAFIRKR